MDDRIHYFDDIRPFLPEELPQAYETLLSDEKFINVLKTVVPEIPFDELAKLMRSQKTNQEFQKAIIYPFVKKIATSATDGIEGDFSALDFNTGYTFISNHRDIVLDSAFLSALLLEHGQDTVEIAIGDNLLIHPWIKNLVRINRSFIVQRALTMRQMLMASKKMSEYIHFVIQEKKSNVWIAQREGRAKDSDDRTQDSVLKMLSMGYTPTESAAKGDGAKIIASLKDLNIVPLAISYELDPCDYLKAEEFQNKRDNPEFKKSQQDDLNNMRIGIFGKKGHVHYHAAPCINQWLDTLDPDTPKTELFDIVAKHIDQEIHKNYMLYPINLWAAHPSRLSEPSEPRTLEPLNASILAQFNCATTAEPQNHITANEYIDSKLQQVSLEHPDWDFLRERILTMYANPARNHFAALGM